MALGVYGRRHHLDRRLHPVADRRAGGTWLRWWPRRCWPCAPGGAGVPASTGSPAGWPAAATCTACRPAAAQESARRLRPSLAEAGHLDPAETGIHIGDTVVGGMPLLQSLEDMAVDIWGPRTGKTTARAIPTIVDFPGPVLVTSIKGDIVDATRDLRSLRGTVLIFDPQDLLRPAAAAVGRPAGRADHHHRSPAPGRTLRQRRTRAGRPLRRVLRPAGCRTDRQPAAGRRRRPPHRPGRLPLVGQPP